MLKETEKSFQQKVIDLARLQGWKVYHTYDSRRSEPGFPDLVLVKPGKLVFAECKTDSGKPTEAQKEWLIALAESSHPECYLFKPANWDKIETLLQKG